MLSCRTPDALQEGTASAAFGDVADERFFQVDLYRFDSLGAETLDGRFDVLLMVGDGQGDFAFGAETLQKPWYFR